MKHKFISKLLICFAIMTMLSSLLIYSQVANASEKSLLDDYDVVEGEFLESSNSIKAKTNRSIAYKKEATSNANGYGVYTLEFTKTGVNRDMGIIFAADRNNTKDFYLFDLRGGNEVRVTYFKDNQKADHLFAKTVKSYNANTSCCYP